MADAPYHRERVGDSQLRGKESNQPQDYHLEVERNRHSFDPATNTHVYWRLTDTFLLGAGFVVIGVLLAVYSSTHRFGHPASSGSSLAFTAVAAVLFIIEGLAFLRPRVTVRPEGITVRGRHRTKVARASEIRAINFGFVRQGEGGFKVWCPYVELVDGSAIWMSALLGGTISGATPPHTLEQVRAIRSMLNVGGTDLPEREPEPLWRRGLDKVRRR